jgi:type VI secretion system protein ImpC
MTSPFNMRFGGVNLTSGASGDSAEMPPETPFRLLVSGDFRGNRGKAPPLEQRKPITVDRDNFDDVMAKMAPSVTLPNPAGGGDLSIAFRELDDFEPDRLFKSLAVFEELDTLKAQLAKPSSFEKAAAKVRSWANVPEPEAKPTPPAAPHETSAMDLIDQVLAERGSQRTGAGGRGDWQRFLDSIVEPNLVEKTDPRQADYQMVVEEAIGAQMRAILHHPAFQALETAWRSVFFLVKRLPTDENLKICILDATFDEWRADLSRDDPSASVFVRELVERAAESPWAAFVSLEMFGKGIDDLETLAAMALVASRARTPVLAGVSTGLVGCTSLATDPEPRTWKPNGELAGAWQMIRGMDAARFLGAVVPRFLLRLPYGAKATRTESFAFEEMPKPDHEQYVWGSGAVAAALLLAEGFVASGWNLNPDDVRQIGELPVHVYADEGETAMKPCAEVLVRETALEALTDSGLMVLASIRERDGVRLVRFQSAAAGTEPLAGRW